MVCTIAAPNYKPGVPIVSPWTGLSVSVQHLALLLGGGSVYFLFVVCSWWGLRSLVKVETEISMPRVESFN